MNPDKNLEKFKEAKSKHLLSRKNPEELTKKFRQMEATMDEKMSSESEETREMMKRWAGEIYSEMDYLHRRMFEMEDFVFQWFGEHLNGHVPNAQTASQMNNFLRILGVDDDYEVQKKVIYARNKQGNVEMRVKFQ